MDNEIQYALSEVKRLGDVPTNGIDSSVDKKNRKELLVAARNLWIALQSPGELVEEVLFGVGYTKLNSVHYTLIIA